MGSVGKPGAEQLLQDLSAFQTFEGMNCILHLFVAGQGSIAKEKSSVVLAMLWEKHFREAGPFADEASQKGRPAPDVSLSELAPEAGRRDLERVTTTVEAESVVKVSATAPRRQGH